MSENMAKPVNGRRTCLKTKNPLLQPLPHAPYDIGQIKPMRASRQFRVTIDTNHYSVPAQLSGVRLSVKSYPDRICIYHENALVARHVRSYDRRCDFEHPGSCQSPFAAAQKSQRPDHLHAIFIPIGQVPSSITGSWSSAA